MNLPNRLTLFRIVLIPVIILIYLFPYSAFGVTPISFYVQHVSISVIDIAALLIYILAAITDAIDGHIVSDQAHKPPAQGPKGELGAWGSRLADVITPGTRTRTTVVTSHIHHHGCGLMPPRFVRKAPGTRPQRIPRAPTPWTQPSRTSGTALQDEPAPPDSASPQPLSPAPPTRNRPSYPERKR